LISGTLLAGLSAIQWTLTYPTIMGRIDCQITEITGYVKRYKIHVHACAVLGRLGPLVEQV